MRAFAGGCVMALTLAACGFGGEGASPASPSPSVVEDSQVFDVDSLRAALGIETSLAGLRVDPVWLASDIATLDTETRTYFADGTFTPAVCEDLALFVELLDADPSASTDTNPVVYISDVFTSRAGTEFEIGSIQARLHDNTAAAAQFFDDGVRAATECGASFDFVAAETEGETDSQVWKADSITVTPQVPGYPEAVRTAEFSLFFPDEDVEHRIVVMHTANATIHVRLVETATVSLGQVLQHEISLPLALALASAGDGDD